MRFVFARLYFFLVVFNASLSWASFDLTKDVRLTLQNVATSEDALRLNFGNKEPAAALIDVGNGEKFSIHSQAKAHSLGHKDYSLGSKDTAEGILGSSRSRNLNSNQDGGSGSFVSVTSMPASFFIASGDSSSNSPQTLLLGNNSSKVFYNQKLSGFNLKADRYAQLTSEGLEKSVQEKFLSDVDQNNSYANLSKVKGSKGSMVASNLPKYNSYSGMNAAFPSIVIPSSLDAGSKEAGSKGFDSVPETSSGSDGNPSHAKADSQSPAKAVGSERTETSSATPSSGSHANTTHSTSTPSSEITSSNPAPKIEGELDQAVKEFKVRNSEKTALLPTSEPKKTEVYAYHDEGDKILDKPLINAGKISLGNAALPPLSAPSLLSEKSLGLENATPDTGGLLSLNPGGGLFQQNAHPFPKAVYWAANEGGGYTGYDAQYKEVAFSLMEPVVFGKLKTKEEIQEGQKLFSSLKKPNTSGKLDLGSVVINTPSAPSLFSETSLNIGDATASESLVPGFNLKVDPTVGANKLGLESAALNTSSASSLFRNKPLSVRDVTTGEGITSGKPSGTKSPDLDFRMTPPAVKVAEEKTIAEEVGSPGAVGQIGVAASSGSQDETPKSETVSLNTPVALSLGSSKVAQENKGLSLGLGAGPIGLGGNSSLVASMSLNQDLNFPSKKLEASSLHYEKQDLKKMDEHMNKKSRCDVARSRFKKYYQSHLTGSTKVDQSDGVAYCYNSSNVKDAPEMLKDVQWRCSHLAQKVVVDPDFSNRKYCIVLKRKSDLTREKLLGSYEAVHEEYRSLTDILYPQSAQEAPSSSSSHN